MLLLPVPDGSAFATDPEGASLPSPGALGASAAGCVGFPVPLAVSGCLVDRCAAGEARAPAPASPRDSSSPPMPSTAQA